MKWYQVHYLTIFLIRKALQQLTRKSHSKYYNNLYTMSNTLYNQEYMRINCKMFHITQTDLHTKLTTKMITLNKTNIVKMIDIIIFNSNDTIIREIFTINAAKKNKRILKSQRCLTRTIPKYRGKQKTYML